MADDGFEEFERAAGLADFPAVTMALADDATWARPPADLWYRVEAGLPTGGDHLDEGTPATGRRWWAAPLATAAVVVPAVVAGVVGFLTGERSNPGPVPDATFVLAGTELVPEATGEGTWRKTPSGLEITLDVSGLPPLPEDAYYQGWLTGPKGTVTIGTFHARRGGDDIVLWSGIEDVGRYDTLRVTRQHTSGGPESSSEVVLVGHISPK